MQQTTVFTRSNAIMIGGLLLCGYFSLLIYVVYLGQTHLRTALFEQEKLTIEKQAEAINYFFSEQRDEIKEFSQKHAFNNFFANRAMRMSMEYGLRASLLMVQNELKRLLHRKKYFNQLVYSSISFIDSDGTVLASTKVIDKPGVKIITPDVDTSSNVSLKFLKQPQNRYIAQLSTAIRYNNTVSGFVVARINVSDVLSPLLQSSTDNNAENTLMLAGPNDEVLLSTASASGKNSSISEQQQIIVPLADTGLMLKGAAGKQKQIILISPWFLAAITLLSFPVIGSVLFLLRLYKNHLLLQEKYLGSQQQRQLIQQAKRRVTAVLEGLDSIVCVTDLETHTVLYANTAAKAVYGELTGKICWQVFYSDRTGPCELCKKQTLLDETGLPRKTQTMEFQNNDSLRWFHCADCAIPWDDDRYVHLRVATDITNRIQNEQDLHKAHKQLKSLAYYDPLTQLANRRLFIDRLARATYKANCDGNGIAVCYLDLDGFKKINDLSGHETGDEVLIQVGQRLKENLRDEDTVARWGGDEFALLINGQKDEQQCADTLTRMLKALANPYEINSSFLGVTTSIGVTLFPQDAGDPETLLRHADQAMYQAKQKGRNCFQFFDPKQDRRITEHRNHVNRIGQAIEKNELRLFYQPKIDMAEGKILGVEALVRWQHPEEGLLPPIRFLPFIKGNKLQVSLDWWVLRKAIEQASHWSVRGEPLSISVNIAAQSLQQSVFITLLKDLLDEYGVDGRLMEMEILESGIIKDLDSISSIIRQCEKTGVTFALDDYGTGFSTLTHIRHLPVHTLKIDQSFIRGMLENREDYKIVEGVIGLAKAFELKVVAEGVETIEIGNSLLELGCRHAQGYCIAKPMPIDEFDVWKKEYQVPQEWLDAGRPVM